MNVTEIAMLLVFSPEAVTLAETQGFRVHLCVDDVPVCSARPNDLKAFSLPNGDIRATSYPGPNWEIADRIEDFWARHVSSWRGCNSCGRKLEKAMWEYRGMMAKETRS